MSDSKASEAVTLRPRPPFRLEPTARVLQRRPINRVDVWDDGRYLRVLPTSAGNRLVVVEDLGKADDPMLSLRVAGGPVSPADMDDLARAVSWLLGAEVDTGAFFTLAREDPALASVAEVAYGLKPPRFPSLFETFLNVVIFQQISLVAALSISGRLVERYGERLEWTGTTYYAYPRPEVVAAAGEDELRRLGLSQRKAMVVKALARMVVEGEVSFQEISALPDDDAVARLTALPGVGLWSAQVILLRGFGRLGVFPSVDSGVRRSLGEVLDLGRPLAPSEEQSLIARYGPVKGMLYLLAVAARLWRMGLITPWLASS